MWNMKILQSLLKSDYSNKVQVIKKYAKRQFQGHWVKNVCTNVNVLSLGTLMWNIKALAVINNVKI